MTSRKTPIVIGVADIVNRSKRVEDAIEPVELMIKAINEAVRDAGLSSSNLHSIDSLDIIKSWTWTCDPDSIAQKLRFVPIHKEVSEHGGNQPAKCVDDAARRISKGEAKLAVVTGGEALASLTACAAAKQLPPPGWSPPDEEITKVFSPTTRELQQGYGARHSCGNPIQLYPLYENAFRAHRGQSIADNHAESANLYADFAKVAENQPYAWSYPNPAETKESIGTVSTKNRMICFPYPLLMNAFNTVNMAAACILTSTEYARELGVPLEKWIFPLGGAGTSESVDYWRRASYWWSPAICRSLDAALDVSAISKDDIDLFDFYSCFPIVPKLCCEHLDIPLAGPKITLLGGLTSFGGAGNAYSLHAITEMVRQLREGRGRTGLVLANGGWLTYQHVLCLSRSPRSDGLPYPSAPPLEKYVTDVQLPHVVEHAEGDAIIETYTVDYDRGNKPSKGHIVGRLSDGSRFIANNADQRTLEELCSWEREPIGRNGRVYSSDGRNLFSFSEVSKL